MANRPRISVPPAEPTVVLSPQLSAPAAAPPDEAAPPVSVPAAAAPVAAVLQQARTEEASPFEATRVAGSFQAGAGEPPVAAAVPKSLIAVGAGALVIVVACSIYLFTNGDDSGAQPSSPSAAAATAPPASATAAASTAASIPPPTSPSAAPTTAAAPAGASPQETEARAALARLRDGIGTCVRDVIGVLPGTSPAIPELTATLKAGPYKSVPRDYRSPVFSCTKYRETEPQRFQIQWQLVTRPSEGRGVVWLDDDNDGKPDRALAFRAALTGKKQVELGDIGPVTPVPPVMKALE